MKIKVFIDRPILAGVISVVILIIGLIGLSQLPIEQFPEIAPPTVTQGLMPKLCKRVWSYLWKKLSMEWRI